MRWISDKGSEICFYLNSPLLFKIPSFTHRIDDNIYILNFLLKMMCHYNACY